jgi:hypothetical protein
MLRDLFHQGGNGVKTIWAELIMSIIILVRQHGIDQVQV